MLYVLFFVYFVLLCFVFLFYNQILRIAQVVNLILKQLFSFNVA